MDKRFQMNPFSSSNEFQLENQSSTAECSNGHSFQEQRIGGGTHLLENQAVDKYHQDDDCEFADGVVLKYMEQMLMEEGMDDEQTRMLQESLDFKAKERSFYELLVDPSSIYYRTNNLTSVVDRFSYPPQINDFSESEVVLNFQKGVDDANQLLLIGSIKGSHLEEASFRGKKKNPADLEEERSTKMAAVYPETNSVPTQELDDVLHCSVGELEKKFEAQALEAKRSSDKAKGRRHTKNQKSKKEVIDFRSLLLHCAQCIAADDRRAADELLKEIRVHSCSFGDGEQRLAHYIADGLEARLAGTGGQMRKSLLKATPASDYLRAHYIYITSSPFVGISNCVSNRMILNESGKANAARVHVIDFGILHGFQWPVYIKRLAEREGGPPKLKITGIDFPQPGFRPAERVKETGRRLAHYAEKFNVPFEFNAIAQNWESIKIADLKLEKGEFVTVNCLYRAESLLDEEAAGVGESPRTMVLDLIRRIKPDYFIHGVVSAANDSPFFVSRFREVLFHYSALYDMLETTMPRGKPERAMLESDIFGKEALNVIACEDRERHVRTETYKQWRLRHLRAGFVQIPFERELMDSSMNMVRNLYHRDFLINEDKDWLLMGWKGKILYAMSCWQPVS